MDWLLRICIEIIRKQDETGDYVRCLHAYCEFRGHAPTWDAGARAIYQAGLPSLKRSVSVSPPFTTSRASVTSAPSCLTLEPITSIASSALNTTPISSRNFLGQRKIWTASVPLFITR